MSDTVTNAIADLKAKMEKVSAIRNRAVYVYDQDDLLNAELQLKTPCAGVIYVGMDKNEKGTNRELSVILNAQIAFIGGEFCELPNSQAKERTTKILDDIRQEVLRTPTVSTELWWRFESEAPFEISRASDVKLLGYAQSWSVPISIRLE